MSKATKGCLGGLSGLLLFLFSGSLGCGGVVAGLLLLALLVYLVGQAIPVVIALIRLLLLIGVLFGLAITVRNYAQALYHNIKPERVKP